MIDGFLQQFILGQVRHWLTLAAGALVTYGLLKTGDSAQFVEIMSGIAMGLIGMAWSAWQKSGHAVVVSLVKKMTPTLPSIPERSVAL